MKNYIFHFIVVILMCVSAGPLTPCSGYPQQSKKAAVSTPSKKGKTKTQNSGVNKTKQVAGKKQTKQAKKKSAPAPSTPESKKLQRQQEQVQQEVATTKKAIRQNDNEIKKGLNELQTLQLNINSTKQKLEVISKEVKTLDSEISVLESKISKERADLEQLRESYRAAVKKMRIAKKQNSDLAFIFSSKSFYQGLRRIRYLREFSKWREKQSRLIMARVKVLETDQQQLAQHQQAKTINLQQEQQSRQRLQNDYAKQDALIVTLKKNGEALQAHLSRKQTEANALRNQVASLIAREEAERRAKAAQQAAEQERQRKLEAERQRAKEQQEAAQKALAQNNDSKSKPQSPATKKTEAKSKDKKDNQDYASARKRSPRKQNNSNPAPSKSDNSPAKTQKPVVTDKNLAKVENQVSKGGSFESMKGSLPRPVGGHFRIKSPFGQHAMPGLPGVTYDNPGIDIETSAGAVARCVAAGTVSGSYRVPGFGQVVIVSHGNYYTVYGNLAGASVSKGDKVNQGQSLGAVSKDSDNPAFGELHFEVWKNRDKLNPTNWIK